MDARPLPARRLVASLALASPPGLAIVVGAPAVAALAHEIHHRCERARK